MVFTEKGEDSLAIHLYCWMKSIVMIFQLLRVITTELV